MLVNVVGNGPARELWDGSGYAIGCNNAQDTRLVCVYDKKPLDEIQMRKWKPAAPVILGPNAEEHARGFRLDKHCKVVGSVLKRRGSPFPRNAGQAAIMWSLRVGFDEIHLWGFDSLWTGLRTSITDELWGQKQQSRDQKWCVGWQSIFDEFPEARPYVHLPKGEKIVERGQWQAVEH